MLLVVFAFSFFGAFELSLPASLANKLDSKADRGGLAGLFFMAATLAVAPFSFTGPFTGPLLFKPPSMGHLLGPAIALPAFPLALGIPFTSFAFFPSLLTTPLSSA